VSTLYKVIALALSVCVSVCVCRTWTSA